MLYIDSGGIVRAERIEVKIFPKIERGRLEIVNGIVAHQTGGKTSESTFSSYSDKDRIPDGAHFLIDKEGKIYQTASLYRITNHVGKLQSRCIKTLNCSPIDLKAAKKAFRSGPTALSKS